MAVYDVCNQKSFESISEQIQNFINYSAQDCSRNIVLVGNKLDLADQSREVSFTDALALARKLGLAGIIETSAKTGHLNCDEAFFITCANALDLQKEDNLPISTEQLRSRFMSDN